MFQIMLSRIMGILFLLVVALCIGALTVYYLFWVEEKSVESEIISTSNVSVDQKFPDDFRFGAATAAFQIEGGWNASGKGPSIWDQFTHDHPELIADGQNADVGPDSYHFFEEDIKIMKSLGMNHYRFSIAWSRVLPDGDISSVNEAGIAYYNNLINKVLEYGIEPMVTMYHYDLPQALQKFGGLTNNIFIAYFESYANLLFDRFGDRVKTWITFNEPADFCVDGYGTGVVAPLVVANGVGEYLCGSNVLKAHAAAYRLYKKRYAERFNGKIGITLSSRFFYSETNNTDDVNRAMSFMLGWFANPIFSEKGDYPSVMTAQIASNSIREGRGWSRLPALNEQWIETIRGSADFLGLNYYTSRYVELRKEPFGLNPSLERDSMIKSIVKPEWKQAKSEWLYSVSTGLADLLRWIKKTYNNPEVLITENGWSDGGELNDQSRIEYLRSHLAAILNVVSNGECNLKGYTVWSIIDNFEWNMGYTEKFGLYAVNLTSTQKERIPKASAQFFMDVIKTRRVPMI